MDVAVRTVNLRKTYLSRGSRRVAVTGLSMAVPLGGVHGFLGPNGSGKTTTIRMLLGLVRADSGTAEVFGEAVPKRLPHVIDRVGAVVESPKFCPAFTARQNLVLLAGSIGSPRHRVDEVLEATHLGDRGRDRYSGFSLGMKQRLAIAATLLKDPDLLIFDEPTNGLDPAGIREVRDTMRTLGEQGKTVLVSSHILTELAEMCDQVGIIERGKLLAVGSVEEIQRQSAADQPQRCVKARVLGGAASLAVWLGQRPDVNEIQINEEQIRFHHAGDQKSEVALLREMVLAGFAIAEFGSHSQSLEDVFMAVTRGAVQ